MHLLMADVASMLGVEEHEVLQRVVAGELPGRKIGEEYHFLKTELDEYVLRHVVKLTPAYFSREESKGLSLASLLLKGGLVAGIPGETVADIIRHGIQALPAFPGLDREDCIQALLAREARLSTAVGNGIGLPHPGSPIIADYDQESITLLRAAVPVSAPSPDGFPVHSLFIVLAANARRHLEILARLAWALSQETILDVLQSDVSLDTMVLLLRELDDVIPGEDFQ